MNCKSATISVVIPAAGSGNRFGSDIPKQYVKIENKCLIEYTLESFLNIDYVESIIVVLSKDDQFFHSLSLANHPKITWTQGGETRADSVLAGIQFASERNQSNNHPHWVLVHDAARPCVMESDINKLVDVAMMKQNGGILATRMTDTVKKTEGSFLNVISETYDRELLWAAATPQFFPLIELKNALILAKKNRISITDEASAIEHQGGRPLLIECYKSNIKVTTKDDLALARFYLEKQGKLTFTKEGE